MLFGVGVRFRNEDEKSIPPIHQNVIYQKKMIK